MGLLGSPEANVVRVCTVSSFFSFRPVSGTRKPSYRWQTRATRKSAKISPIRRAYNVQIKSNQIYLTKGPQGHLHCNKAIYSKYHQLNELEILTT